MFDSPVVSITVVAFNSADVLPHCLNSVNCDVLKGFAELHVVDNASPDESAEIVTRDFPWVQLIRSAYNRGFAGGCNLAWPESRGRYWLLLNPDVVVPEGGLRRLVEWMDRHPRLGAASPDLSGPEGFPICPGRPFPSISRALLELTRLHLLMPKKVRQRLLQGQYVTKGDQLDVGFVPGTALIVRREAVEAAGLLSEKVLIYGEDSEWCWRIRDHGWNIGVCGDICFVHNEGTSTRRTWGDEERTLRLWAGIYDSCRIVKGRAYTRLLMAINMLAFAVEAKHPGRTAAHGLNSQKLLNAHWSLWRGGAKIEKVKNLEQDRL